MLHEIRDDQEVADETRFLDDAKFELQPVNDRLNRCLFIGIGGIKRRQTLRVINAFDNEFLPLRLRMNRVAAEQCLREQMPQITFACKMLRRIEHRIVQRLEIEFDIALLGDFQRVRDGFGNLREARLHFLGATQIKLFRHVTRAHAIRIAQQILCADAHQTIVRVRVTFLNVVNVIRCDAFQPEFLRPRNQMLVHFRLLGDAVILEFEIKILRPERLLEPIHRIPRLRQLVLHDRLRNLAGETTGQRDQSLFALRENFFVNARLVVIALQMRGRGEFNEILVANFVLRQQDEMVVNVLAASGRFLFQSRPRRDVNLAPDDRLDAFLARFLPKIHDPMHRPVIGDGERGQFQVARLLDEFVQPARAIEQRILGVQMQMDEISVRHGIPTLACDWKATQGRVAHSAARQIEHLSRGRSAAMQCSDRLAAADTLTSRCSRRRTQPRSLYRQSGCAIEE